MYTRTTNADGHPRRSFILTKIYLIAVPDVANFLADKERKTGKFEYRIRKCARTKAREYYCRK